MNHPLNVATQRHISGDLAGAAQGYAAILKQDPQNADAWHLAGLLAHQMNQSENAIQQIRLAIELNPENAEYFANLASILNSKGKPELAEDAARQSVKLNEDFPVAHIQLGMALASRKQYQEAIGCFETALQKGGDSAIVFNETSRLRQFAGDIEGAINDIESSLKLEPVNPQAYFQLSQFVSGGHYAFNGDQVEFMQQLLAVPELALDSRNRLHVALAVHYQTQGDYPQAFKHFERAADASHTRLSEKGFRFQRSKREELVDDLIEFFNPQNMERLRSEESKRGNSYSTKPLFIIGMPRSGTTLLQQILSQFAPISSGGELMTMNELITAKVGDGGETRLRDTLTEATPWWISDIANRYLTEITKLDANEKSGDGAKWLVDKMPGNFLYIGFIKLMFPDATIIHCKRDPRAICFSCFSQSFTSDRLQFETSKPEYLVAVYKNYSRLMDHWNQLFAGEIFQVQYEHLLSSPKDELIPILNHLGIEWNEECLDFYKKKSTVETASALQVRSPLQPQAKELWRRYEPYLADFFQTLDEIS